MLDCCTPLEEAQKTGINMEQFVCVARCNGLDASPFRGSDIPSLDDLRHVVSICEHGCDF